MFFCQNKTVSKILVLIIPILRKALFPHILARFSKLNHFRINFFPKEVILVTFFPLEMTFSRDSADSAFSF